MVNPEWLRYFRVVAETRNMRVAAERLHVSHQALSHAIAKLEDYYGQILLDRGQRVRGLTRAGEVFFEEIRGLVEGFDNLDVRMAELRGEVPLGPVKIASASPLHIYMLPPLLARLLARYPGIRPQLFAMGCEIAERWVAAGEVDLGLIAAEPTRSDLAWASVRLCRYVIVAQPGQTDTWDHLDYIVPRRFDGTGGREMDGWPDFEFPRRVVAEVDHLEAALHLVEAGLGAAFVPDIAVASRLELGVLGVAAEAPFEYSERIHVVWRDGARLSPAVRETLALLRANF